MCRLNIEYLLMLYIVVYETKITSKNESDYSLKSVTECWSRVLSVLSAEATNECKYIAFYYIIYKEFDTFLGSLAVSFSEENVFMSLYNSYLLYNRRSVYASEPLATIANDSTDFPFSPILYLCALFYSIPVLCRFADNIGLEFQMS